MPPNHPTPVLARRTRPSLPQAMLVAACASAALLACGESVTQVGSSDVARVRVSADSARVGLDRTFDLDAFALDVDGGLLIGPAITWSSSNEAVVTVDANGLLSGKALGTAEVVASFGALRDTTFVTVVEAPRLVLSADSVGFAKAADAGEPASQTVDVTNGGVLDLIVTVDSIAYGPGANGWLSAQLAASAAPTELELSTSTGTITAAGTYTAHVWLSGFEADDSPAAVEVTLTVTAGAPSAMTAHQGDGQNATVGTDVDVPPAVRVLDAFDNPAVGASVTFDVTGGGGTVTGSPATVDAAGIARVGSWTLGTVAGPNELTATLGSLPPVVFGATGDVGPAAQVVVVDGDNQGATAGTPVPIAPTVSVQDQHGNGVQGVTVTFAVTSGGGSVEGDTQVSGDGGIAAVDSWTLGIAAGPNTLSATAAGVATPAIFTATGLSGQADSIFLVAGNAQQDTVAATLPAAYRVRVVDVNGNGVEGIPVTWQATAGGGSITPNSVTDADGYATATRVLGTVPGANAATANVGGLKGSPVQFNATATVGSPHQVVIVNGNNQSATVATAVAVDPQVRVVDRFDNPIQGVPVTFSVTAGGTGAAVVPVTPINTNASGLATVTSWTLGETAGTNNNQLRATATGIATFVTFTASAIAGAPASIAIVQGNNQTAITGTNVATNPTVVVRDMYLNPVSGRTVNFSASGSGSVGSPSPRPTPADKLRRRGRSTWAATR